jgi:selenocysteine lyase/cysteine desulfurase
VHLFEEWGLPIWKTDENGERHDGAQGMTPLKDGGKPVRSGKWQIMINGESYKWIVAEAAKKALGMDRIAAAEHELLVYANERLATIPGLRFVGTAPEKAAVVSFTLDKVHPHDLGTILDSEGVAIRTGHHCCQPLMARFGISGTTRASFALYNTLEEIAAFGNATRRAVRMLR